MVSQLGAFQYLERYCDKDEVDWDAEPDPYCYNQNPSCKTEVMCGTYTI
jgi:hypothetical protein